MFIGAISNLKNELKTPADAQKEDLSLANGSNGL